MLAFFAVRVVLLSPGTGGAAPVMIGTSRSTGDGREISGSQLMNDRTKIVQYLRRPGRTSEQRQAYVDKTPVQRFERVSEQQGAIRYQMTRSCVVDLRLLRVEILPVSIFQYILRRLRTKQTRAQDSGRCPIGDAAHCCVNSRLLRRSSGATTIAPAGRCCGKYADRC